MGLKLDNQEFQIIINRIIFSIYSSIGFQESDLFDVSGQHR